MVKIVVFIGFLACLPLANWLILNVGTHCIPDGPCLIPVGFGLDAPSGVLVIGAAIVLRDAIHRLMGWHYALAAIAIGTLITWQIAPPALVIASVVAFALSELLNQAVYAPLHRRRLILAVFLSSIAAAFADSALFLWLAFGSMDYVIGQTVGKAWATVLAVGLIAMTRSWTTPQRRKA